MNRQREILVLFLIVMLLIFVPGLAGTVGETVGYMVLWVRDHVDITILSNGTGA